MMPGDRKAAIHSVDNKNHLRGRNVGCEHHEFHGMGTERQRPKRKIIIYHEVVLVHVLPNLLRGRKSKTSVIQC